MSDRKNVRTAIAALVRVGKSNREISTDLECSKTLVLKVKRRLSVGKGPQVSPRKRKKTTLTLGVVGGLKKRIKAAPTKSLRRVARESKVPRELVRQVVRDADWRSLRTVKVPQELSPRTNPLLFRRKNLPGRPDP